MSSVFRVSYSILLLVASIASMGRESDSFTIKEKHNNDVTKSPSKKCEVNEKVYDVNETMYIPNDWSASPQHAMCLKCTCSSDGTPRDCKGHYHCHLGSMCARYKNVTGECCPRCDCFHDGKVMEEGSKWIIKSVSEERNVCTECACGGNAIATCITQTFLCYCDGEQIPDPNNCCPKCVPKATTTKPPVGITLPSTAPPPIFLPFPGPQ